MGPLDFLEPFVALGGALSFVLTLLIFPAVGASLLAPGVLVLVAPSLRGWQRALLFLAATFGALLALAGLRGVESIPAIAWLALAAYAAWALPVVAAGVLRLLVRAVRFVFRSTHEPAPQGAVERVFYGFGALAIAVLMVGCALAGTGPGRLALAGWGAELGLLGLLVVVRRKPAAPRLEAPRVTPRSPAARLLWLTGCVLLALASPPAAVLLVALCAFGPMVQGGLSKGVPLAALAVMLCALAAWMMRAGRRLPPTHG